MDLYPYIPNLLADFVEIRHTRSAQMLSVAKIAAGKGALFLRAQMKSYLRWYCETL
jgi:hypothetical protein